MAETMELQDSAVDRLDGKEQLSKDEEKYLNELKEKVETNFYIGNIGNYFYYKIKF